MYRSASNSTMSTRISPKLIPAISGIKSKLILAYVLPFLAPPYIIYITRTEFSIQFQWYHSLDIPETSWQDIRVFLP